MSEDALERAAMRKFLFRAAGIDEDEPIPDDYTIVDAANDAVQRLEELEQMEERIESAEMAAQSAIGVAKSEGVADGGTPPKKERAKRVARNEVVRQALTNPNADSGGVTVGKVQDMLRPDLNVAYQTVKDAFDDLVEGWPAFEEGENAEGNRELLGQKSEMSQDLVGAVEMDLDRDDLTKRLISRGD